ncbi:MRC1-like domain-containing protein [Dactylonectria macrodidyma]|uniref:MRC1-like domain-containing protein n=1 Tax=Dactylonectria macrodidyma TaxID=307937 RepID=A0A9P9F0D2_9HYPO|nr:MRC1-like domain-containing protein [Dactylonectria macrodidyma]
MSSPASSPTLGGSPEPLTPQSKIRALLATVESSDEETSPSTKATNNKILQTTQLDTRSIGLPRLSTNGVESDESDEEIRPRGRLASRMQGATRPAEKATTETARERVKKMLALEEQEAEKTRDVTMADAEDEDNQLPIVPRRLKRKLAQAPTADNTTRATRSPSPGLFVSSPVRPSPSKSDNNVSDLDDDLPTPKPDRFNALVERVRQARLAKEAEEEARNAERRAQREKLASELDQLASDDEDSGITDDEGGRKLTQGPRPSARKASKKAIEDMNRETQRMARNMQLAHQAKTRKRITKSSLFQRFNFRPTGEPEPKTASSSRPTSSHSDAEMQDADTPPSSPPVAKTSTLVESDGEVEGAELPSVDALASSLSLRLDKGKGKAVDVTEQPKSSPKTKRQVRVKLPPVAANITLLDSDDELEITTSIKDKMKAVFDSIPSKKAQESHSLQALRALAQVRSPGRDHRRRRTDTHEMTAVELQVSLQQKARQQAKLERERRLGMLKAQGVVIQTAEEREREMQEVEDIVAKARDEDHKLMQQEREEVKKERKESGEVDPLAWDDSDDEEYQASGDEADAEVSAVELSGSEEDEDENEEEEAESNPMFEDEAEDAEASDEDAQDKTPVASQDVDEDVDELPVVHKRRARKQVAVITDDEDEDDVQATPRPKTVFKSPTVATTQSPAAPTSVLRSAKKTFIPGLPVQGPAGLGLTQMFAGTMDDSQTGPASGPTQSMMPDFDNFPDSNFSATMDDPEDMVVDSQRQETQGVTQGIQLNFSQSQMRGLDSLLREESITQFSDMVELSQDGGFRDYTPIKDRFIEPPVSTVETVMVDQNEVGPDSPLVRRGRLRRRTETPLVEQTPEPIGTQKPETAFNKLNEGAKKEKKRELKDSFNLKKSKAKEMVEEQAEESEDEYAGLGGVDGEDSDNESIASVKEMIDDAAGNNVDDAKLAAFYADRERVEDEKQVKKLYKDITTGLLRRKRGADYDLSDSDDDGEARRRMKRRQFAKRQKALFTDERVKKIAENPGNQAFLRTIEDQGSDDEMDFLGAIDQPMEESQESQSQDEESVKQQTIPDSQPRKPLSASGDNRLPTQMRRSKDGKKPSNIGEVRETLSNLLEETHSTVIPATDAGSDSEDDENMSLTRSDKENHEPNPRRGRVAVVDRISLKRNNSSISTTSSNLAFATASSSAFKVPALLRRATTNSLMSGSSSSTSTGVSTPSSGFGEEAKIKKNAGKRSGVNAFARDSERRARLEQSERRREERKIKGAEKRISVVGGLLGKGTFE